MKFLELLVESLDPFGVYQSAQNMATNIFMFLTPFLLVIAVAIRTLETQLDTVSSLGKWERALRDFIGFGVLIASYFGIMTLVNLFMNEVYLLTNDFGNYLTLSKKLKILMDQGLGLKQTDHWLLEKAKGLDVTPHGMVIFLIYRVSNIFVVTAYVFLQAAHAITYSFALVMGLIILPMAIATKFNYLKGWGLVLGTAFLWPIVESLFMGLAGDMFMKSVQGMLDEQAKLGPGVILSSTAGIRSYFSVVNFVLGGIMITAPIVTGAVLMGGNAMFPMVAPFAAGSMGLASIAFSAGKSAMPGGLVAGTAGALGGMMATKSGGAGLPPSSGGASGGWGGSNYSGGPKPRSGGDGGASNASSTASSSGGTSGGAGGGASEESGPTPQNAESQEAEQQAKEKKRKQAQKGAMVNQARKKKMTE